MINYEKGQRFVSPDGRTKITILSNPNELGQISFSETIGDEEVIFYGRDKKFIDLVISMAKAERKPSLEEIKWVLQYLDEELLVEGTFEEVCEYVRHLKEIK